MKKTRILAVVLSLCMLLALVPVAALADFTDIDEATNENYAGAIERWSDEGVISGVGNDTFDPKGTMTRVQGFGIIANLLNLTEKADLSEYTDVPTDGWKADYLAKVVAAGIVTGYPDKTLRPEGELTREQMFVTIAKTLGIQPVETDDEEFEDIGEAADYAAPYINALHKMGAVNGSNGNVNPLETLSREGAALLLDNLIGGYANTEGETVEIEKGKITLVVADNVAVKGEITEEDMPIVVAGQAGTVDMKEVTGDVAPTVNVTVSDVTINDAPVGTEITATETAENVTANGIDVSSDPDKDVVVPEPEPEQSYTPPPVFTHTNEAETAMNAAWNALNTALGNMNGLVTASNSGSTYTLTINFDELTSTDKVLDGDGHGLATAIGDALNTHLKENHISLTVGGQDVYTADGTFDHTGLKNALFTVAGGFFYDLGNLPDSGEFRSVSGVATANNCTQSPKCTYNVTLKVVLTGDKLSRVKTFAKKLSEYVSMTKINASDVAAKYGEIQSLTGETEYIVVCLDKLPQSLLNKVDQAYSGQDAQNAFENATVSALLTLLAQQTMDDSLAEIETLARMINTNAGLINTVLDHVSAKVLVNGESKDLITMGSDYAPDAGEGTAFAKLVKGVNTLLASDAKDLTPGQFKVTQGSPTGKYIVPVTVHIDLQSSLGFTADETILVELNIDLSSVNS